jgi:hypothetical protein
MQRESRGRWSTSTKTFSIYPCFGDVPRAQQPEEWMGFIGGMLWVERRGAGGRMASRGRFWPIQRVLYPGGGLGARGFDHHGLGSWAVLSGRRCELRARVWSARSVVEHWSQKRAGFCACARLVELVLVALVGFGSRGLARGEGLTMPCRNGRGTARSRSPSAGNMGLALGALGVQATMPKRGDRVAFASARLWGGVGSWSGGSGASIGEAGRPGRAAYAPSLTRRSLAGIGDRTHGGRVRASGSLLGGVLGGLWCSTHCWLGVRGGGEG